MTGLSRHTAPGTARIGWYVHHHGRGHLARLEAVRRWMTSPVTAFGSRPAPGVEPLPMDLDAPRSAACAAAGWDDGWHYAPLGVAGLRTRMTRLARWVAETDPSLVVVDVSVEVAELMRLLSVPTVVVRQHGARDDAAHRRCHADAAALLAPWPSWLEDPSTPPEVLARTIHTGGFSTIDGTVPDKQAARAQLDLDPDVPLALVVGGGDGDVRWPVADAAAATPGWRWQVLTAAPERVRGVPACWTGDVAPWYAAADVVIGHAGHNVVMEAAAADRPMVVVPQPRPFGEQHHKARLLEAHDVCLVADGWPAAGRWPALLRRARSLDPGPRRAMVDGTGAARAAQAIEDVAARFAGPAPVPAPEVVLG